MVPSLIAPFNINFILPVPGIPNNAIESKKHAANLHRSPLPSDRFDSNSSICTISLPLSNSLEI